VAPGGTAARRSGSEQSREGRSIKKGAEINKVVQKRAERRKPPTHGGWEQGGVIISKKENARKVTEKKRKKKNRLGVEEKRRSQEFRGGRSWMVASQLSLRNMCPNGAPRWGKRGGKKGHGEVSTEK